MCLTQWTWTSLCSAAINLELFPSHWPTFNGKEGQCFHKMRWAPEVPPMANTGSCLLLGKWPSRLLAEGSDYQAVMEKKGSCGLFCLNIKNKPKAGTGLCTETDPLPQGWVSLTANSSCGQIYLIYGWVYGCVFAEWARAPAAFALPCQLWRSSWCEVGTQTPSSSAKTPKHLHQIWHSRATLNKISRAFESVAGPQLIFA